MNNCAVKGRKLKEYNTSWFRRDSMVSSTSNIGRKFGYGKKFIPSIRMTCDMISPPPLPLGFLKFAKAIRCTLPNCLCECFAPGKLHLRTCETCKHGWVTHALDKLGYQHIFNMGMQVEIVQPNIVFDIASLMLYGSQATPIRLKILLDRLFSVLQHDEVLQVLHGFGWSYEDYARGYILQDASGRVLDKWSVATREEEHIILQQFLRFGETKSIAQEIILQDTKEKQDLYVKQTAKAESEIKKFIERSNLTMQSYMRPYESRHLFSSRLPFVPTSNRLITPPALHGYTPTTPPRDLRPPSIPPVPTSSPLTSSPLGRLQTMQPFDFRREPISPAVSPGLSEKHASRQPSGGESPKNLSTTPTPTPASNSPPQFQSQKLHEGTDSIAMPSINPPTVITQEDPPVNAINYSTKDCEDSALSVFADRKVKHLRKSANPIKRQWTPSASFGSTLIAPNGKKRVLCTACNKTFCDKGALKIHYSAVHLKEMHKCTVEGCNMMFSSRRSRNRHSANPNPKLHMPQKRKIPDGVTIIDSKTPSRLINSPPTMVVTSSFLHRNPITSLDSHDMSRNEQSCFVDITSSLSFLSTPEKRIKLENTEEAASSEAPDIKDKLQAEEMLKQDIAMQRGFNRRKSLIPTRCAQTEEMYIMSDENSSERDAVTGECGMHYCTNTKIVTDSVKTEYEMNTEKTDIKKEIPASPKPESTENKSSPKANSTVEVSGHGVICDINSSQKLEARKEACHFPRIASLLANTSTDPLDLSQDPCVRSPSNISSTLSQGSDHDSNMSQSSTDSPAQTPTRTNGSHSPESSSSEIPLDKENPRKCTVCGKIFQNHFGVKTHYQNVHLKLMHTCTVEGCNAAFPSKRSRDRHSANLNLHRKLLSTSDMEGCEKDSLRDDILPKLYDSQTISTFADNSSEENENSPNSQMNNKSKGEVTSSGSQSDDSLVDDENALSPATGDHSYSSGGSPDNSGIGEDDMQADEFDSTVTCHVCQQKFKDNLVLKEHFETLHPKEMFHCTVSGCEKIFSTRKSRNRHSQNDNLHRHLSSTKTNGLS